MSFINTDARTSYMGAYRFVNYENDGQDWDPHTGVINTKDDIILGGGRSCMGGYKNYPRASIAGGRAGFAIGQKTGGDNVAGVWKGEPKFSFPALGVRRFPEDGRGIGLESELSHIARNQAVEIGNGRQKSDSGGSE